MNNIDIHLVLNLGKALLSTIILELIVIRLLREKRGRVYLFSIIINLFTNPIMNLALQAIPWEYYEISLIGFEIIVVAIEAISYYFIVKDFLKAIKISFLCNFVSYTVGIFLIPYLY